MTRVHASDSVKGHPSYVNYYYTLISDPCDRTVDAFTLGPRRRARDAQCHRDRLARDGREDAPESEEFMLALDQPTFN